jgi:hypothetical protein
MTTKLFSFALAIILLFAQSLVLFAQNLPQPKPQTQPHTQQGQRDWASVRAILLVLIALLAKPQITLAQVTTAPVMGSWEGVKAIPPGDEVVVNLRDGQTLIGRLVTVSDTALTIDHEKRTTDISRGGLLRIYRLTAKSAKKSTLISLGIGAGVGVASSGINAANRPIENGEYALGILVSGMIGAGIGSLTGYIIGSRRQRVLIYETK